ncbi:immunity 53 family protein [Burkholderia ubonensis]|uniref:immunity 53 family protein n=1 Tax=Burkholderia ubonensis TaxID=101571 RepID=UPI0012F9E003|nr:immunity 53 family protein [Burkholderia ubonensis]
MISTRERCEFICRIAHVDAADSFSITPANNTAQHRITEKIVRSITNLLHMTDPLTALQRWYASRCNGVWEHAHGIEIANIDNPGWRVKIDGASDGKPLDLHVERDEMDWISIRATDTAFAGYGGPGNLPELLALAADWIKEA